MRESANYKFNLPDKADQFNLDHWNQNTEKLDEKFKSIDDLTNNDLKTSLLNFIYPVGSLYWSSKPTDPGILFGGNWVQIKDRFVLAAGDTYTNGATGGNANTTLTEANLPSHSHSFTPKGTVSAHSHGLNNHTHSFSGSHVHRHEANFYYQDAYNDTNKQYDNWFGSRIDAQSFVEHTFVHKKRTTEATVSISGTTGRASGNTDNAAPTFTGTAGTTGTTGSGTAFSNLPPYVVKYCWERTA